MKKERIEAGADEGLSNVEKTSEEILHESRRRFLKQAVTAGVTAALLPGLSLGKAFAAGRPIPPAPGAPLPWQIGENVYSGILNVATGNYQLTQPICGWAGIGGGIALSLYFNSQSSRTDTPLGSKWSHSFSLRIIGTSPAIVVAGDGTETKFTLSGNAYTAPAGIYDRLVRNADTTWTLTRKGGYQVYRFNASGVLTTITDNNNNVTTCAYSGGQLASVTDPTGRALTFGYTGGKLTSITDFESRVWTLTYTGSQLTQVSDPVLSGVTYRTAFAYTSGNVTGVTNRLNKTWAFTYGSVNDLITMTDPDGKIWNYSLTIPSAGAGARTALPTDPWPSDVVAVGGVTDPTNLVVQYGFDSAARVSAIRGATDNRAVYSYNSANNRLSLQTDSGATWNWSYDTQGNPLQASDPLGKITQMTYDAASRPLTVKDPLNNTTTYQYDTAGNRTQVIDPLGNATITAYNTLGLITQITDARGKNTQFLYDAYGNQTRITDPLGNQINFQFQNGNADRVSRRTDAMGRITDYNYDAWGRQTGIRYVTTGNSSIISTYDAEGRLTQSVDGTGTRTYSYDAWSRRISMTDPMGNTQATYDSAGRLKTQTDVAGRTHTYGYDNYQRLASVNDGSQTVQYTYTSDSKIATCLFPNGTRAEYSYDFVGRPTSIMHKRVSNNSVIVGYTGVYDNAGRLTQIMETPSGAVTTYQYDNSGRLLREERTNDQIYLGIYTYDPNGNHLTALRSENGNISHNGTYSYDDASRLIQVVDSANNSTNQYNWNSDGTLSSYPGAGYTRRLSYNEERQLTMIRRDYGGGNVQIAYEYGYGADGNRRWSKDYAANIWTWFPCGIACEAGELVEKRSDLSGSAWLTNATYLRANKAVVSRNGEFHHSDILQRFSTLTNQIGTPVATALFDMFGVRRYMSGVVNTPLMSGRDFDEGIVQQGGCTNLYIPQINIKLQQKKGGDGGEDGCTHQKMLDQCLARNNAAYNSANQVCIALGFGCAACALLPVPAAIICAIACAAGIAACLLAAGRAQLCGIERCYKAYCPAGNDPSAPTNCSGGARSPKGGGGPPRPGGGGSLTS
jgi:hypothetical protein